MEDKFVTSEKYHQVAAELREVRDQLKNKTFWNVFFPVCSYLLLFINVVNLMSNATTPGQQPMLCNCSTTMPSNSSSSTGYMRVTSANHWTVTRLQQESQVTLQRAQELGDVATELASHTLLVTSAWGSSTLAATRQAAASVQLPALLQHWLSQLQATLDLLTPQAPPSVYGPHLQPSTGSVSVSPVDPWALHRLAHAASRPQLLQQMGVSVPYASAQQQMQQVMRAAVQGHATLAGTTPAAAAQALQAANAAIAELLSAVQVTLRPLQHQGGASQSPVADNTTCSTQERPTGLPAAASVTAAAAAAAPAPAAAPAALHCVLPALHFTQCNVDPAAAGLASCPACNCKGSSSASDELFKMAAEGLQSMEKSIKKCMAPAAAWTTLAIAKAQAATEQLKTEATELANRAQQLSRILVTVTGLTKNVIYSTRGWMRPAEQPEAALQGAAVHVTAQSWHVTPHMDLNSTDANVTTSHNATTAAGWVM